MFAEFPSPETLGDSTGKYKCDSRRGKEDLVLSGTQHKLFHLQGELDDRNTRFQLDHLVEDIFLSKLGASLGVDCQGAGVARHNFYPATTAPAHNVNHQLKF